MCAYNYHCGGGDTTTTARPRVKAGDTILVHAGVYKYHPEFYGPDRTINATSPYEGTYYLTASGTAERADRDQGSGRRRGHLRRRRQLQSVQRQGGELQLLRGRHVPEYRHRDLGRHAVHRRFEGADGEEMPIRKRRHRRLHELLRLERFLHRRQLLSSAATIRRICSAGAATSGRSSRAWTARSFRRPWRRMSR